MPIYIIRGDITERSDMAIVNAANERLLAGSGVCGAIHRVAGPELEKACLAIGGCPTGSAVITPGFKLQAKYVIHAVGPRWWDGTRGEEDLLRRCYESIFALVKLYKISSIAIPAIGTGIYHYSLEGATRVAMDVAKGFLGYHEEIEVTFVCFDDAVLRCYTELG